MIYYRRKEEKKIMKYDLVMDDGNWWVFNLDTRSFDHSFEIDETLNRTSRDAQEKAFAWAWNLGDEIRDIVNDDREWDGNDPKVISIKGWDGNDHWMVAWEFADGELAKVRQFPTKEEAEKWLIEFN